MLCEFSGGWKCVPKKDKYISRILVPLHARCLWRSTPDENGALDRARLAALRLAPWRAFQEVVFGVHQTALFSKVGVSPAPDSRSVCASAHAFEKVAPGAGETALSEKLARVLAVGGGGGSAGLPHPLPPATP